MACQSPASIGGTPFQGSTGETTTGAAAEASSGDSGSSSGLQSDESESGESSSGGQDIPDGPFVGDALPGIGVVFENFEDGTLGTLLARANAEHAIRVVESNQGDAPADAVSGDHALRIELRPEDADDDGLPQAELLTQTEGILEPGGVSWVQWYMFIPEDFDLGALDEGSPIEVGRICDGDDTVVTSIALSTDVDSGALHWRVRATGLQDGEPVEMDITQGDAAFEDRGRWVRLRIAYDPAIAGDGSVRVWRDSDLIGQHEGPLGTTETAGDMLYATSGIFNIGTNDIVVFVDDFEVSVEPPTSDLPTPTTLPGTQVFHEDFDDGTLGEFNVQAYFDHAQNIVASGELDAPAEAISPSRVHRFELRPDDQNEFGRYRTELHTDFSGVMQAAETNWIEWFMYFPADFNPGRIDGDQNRAVIIGQVFHPFDGAPTSPAMTISIRQNPAEGDFGPYYWSVMGKTNTGGTSVGNNITVGGLWAQPFDEEGTWVRLTMAYRSSTSGDGFIRVWVNDTPIGDIEGDVGGNDHNAPYFKTGLYHQGSNPIVTFVDEVQISIGD